jgi:hypothetical protein
MQAEGKISELLLLDGSPAARILCPEKSIPRPGQYLLAHAAGTDSPLAVPVFATRSEPDGFLAAPSAPADWVPGMRLHLRGPLGHGFDLPASARRCGLIALEAGASARRLLALLDVAFRHGAAVTLVCDAPPDDLPLQVEVQPRHAVSEVCGWADYVAIDVGRDSLHGLRASLGLSNPAWLKAQAQVLVRAPMPCGGLAGCGVCAVEGRRGTQLACEGGPVFDLGELI